MADLKIGLALGCGAARGWAHIGILEVLRRAGIVPDIIAGTSMGAVVGGCHAAGKLDELEEFARSLTRRRVFGYLDLNFGGSGLINGQRLTERLEHSLSDTPIQSLTARYVAVATEIGTGHEVWVARGRLVDAMRASYALPGIFKPVRIDGRWLFDGALVNPVPVSVCRALGARYVIAVNLNADISGKGTVVPQLVGDRADPEAPEPDAAEFPAMDEKPSVRKLLQRQILGRGDVRRASRPSWSRPSTSYKTASRAPASPGIPPMR
jgi:NTE family protein